MAKGILLVLSNASEGADEEEFNRWYTNVHAPEIVERGAAVSFRRFKASGVPLRPDIPQPVQQYVAVYEIEAETVDEVRACEQRLRDSADQSNGISPTIDFGSVRAAFLLPV